MEIPNGRKSLAKEFEAFCFADDAMFILISKESAILSELHDHIDSALLDECIPELNYMRVVHSCMQIDLSLQQQQLILAPCWTDVDLHGERGTIFTA